MAREPDFRPPLKMCRASFARIGPGLGLPDDAKEEVRKIFQAAERRGAPHRETSEQLGWIVGEHIWTWPWWDEWAATFNRNGQLPRYWEQEGIKLPARWAEVPHGPRCRILTSTLAIALSAVWNLEQMQESMVFDMYRISLQGNDDLCPVTIETVARFRPLIEAGDYSNLPPYFPGDGSSLRFERKP